MSLQKLTNQLREEIKLKNKLINDLQQKLDEKVGSTNLFHTGMDPAFCLLV